MATAWEFRFLGKKLFRFHRLRCFTQLVYRNSGVRSESLPPRSQLSSQLDICARYRNNASLSLHCTENRDDSDPNTRNIKSIRFKTPKSNVGSICSLLSVEKAQPLKHSVGKYHRTSVKFDYASRGKQNIVNKTEQGNETTIDNHNGTDKHDFKKENIFTVPNALTMSRIILSPVLGYLVLEENYVWACGLFIYAGTTDWIDGYIARKFPSQRSALGSLIDPLGDKILMTILTVTLASVDLLPVPLAVLIIGRDVALLTGGLYIRYRMLPPPKTLSRIFNPSVSSHNVNPTVLSKLNTFCQISLIAATLGSPIFNYVDHTLLHAMWYMTGTTTLLSGLSYVFTKDTYSSVQNKDSPKTRS